LVDSGVTMRRSRMLPLAAVLAVAVAGCGAPETGAQRVTRMRDGYRVEPNGFRARRGGDGAPELVVDVLVVDTGREALTTLTLLVHVQGPDGRDRLARRTSLDVAGLVPGVTSPAAAVLRGVELGAGDNVMVELEAAPPPEALAEYPESATSGRSGS